MAVRYLVKHAANVGNDALEALQVGPDCPGALPVMGVWNAEVIRLRGAGSGRDSASTEP